MKKSRILKITKEKTYREQLGEYWVLKTSSLIQTAEELSKKYNLVISKVEDNIWDDRTWFYTKAKKKDYEDWARELLSTYSDYISGFKI